MQPAYASWDMLSGPSSSFVFTHGCKNLNPKKQPGHPKMGKEDPQQIEASGSSVCSLSLYRAIEDYIKAQRVGPVVYQGLETPASGLFSSRWRSFVQEEEHWRDHFPSGRGGIEEQPRERGGECFVSTLGAKVLQSPLQCIKGYAEMSFLSTSIFVLTLIMCTPLVFPAKRLKYYLKNHFRKACSIPYHTN